MDTILISQVIKSLIALIIILDPFLGMIIYVSLTKGMDRAEKARQAAVAVGVAFTLLIVFLFSGLFFLELLGISLSSFMVAGGVILLLLGIQAVLGIEFSKKTYRNQKAVAIIIGTPLLCGPGAMSTIIILSQQYGILPPLIASLIAMAITWVMLIFADSISRRIGERMIEIVSRVMGLMLAGLAIEFIRTGIEGMVTAFLK